MRILAVSLFLLPMLAWADKAADITWIKLTVVIYGGTVEEQEAHLLSHGFSADGAKAVREYVERGEAEVKEQETQLLADLCTRRAQVEQEGQEKFAQETEYVERTISGARKSLVDNLKNVLSPTDAVHLDHLLKHHNVQIFDTEIPKKIREGKIPAKPTLSKLCKTGA